MATHRATKWLKKAWRISNTISDLKEEDIKEWRRDYYSGTRTAAGVPFQNLGKYLSLRGESEAANRRADGLGETSKEQYRTMARMRVSRIDEIEAEELASRILQARERQREQQWRDPEWLADLALDLRLEHARIYEPGVEMRLREEELSIADIESVEDLRERARRYGERRRRAPQILDEIVAEADTHRAEMVAALAARHTGQPSPREDQWRHYDSDEGWGRKHKYKRTHKNKRSRSRKGSGKRKKSRKH